MRVTGSYRVIKKYNQDPTVVEFLESNI